MVRQMLINRSAPQPRSRKTPRGGRRMAKMILQTSEAVKGMMGDVVLIERETK